MKKVITIVLVAVMIATMALSVSAAHSTDRLYVNANTLEAADSLVGSSEISIAVGDKMYILGWCVIEGGLKEVVYTVDGGENIACEDNYRERPDLSAAGISAEGDDYSKAGFGKDEGMMELLGIDALADGTYAIVVNAVSNTGAVEALAEFTLIVGTGINAEPETPEETPDTADAAILVAAVVAAIALAGVVVTKKVRA